MRLEWKPAFPDPSTDVDDNDDEPEAGNLGSRENVKRAYANLANHLNRLNRQLPPGERVMIPYALQHVLADFLNSPDLSSVDEVEAFLND